MSLGVRCCPDKHRGQVAGLTPWPPPSPPGTDPEQGPQHPPSSQVLTLCEEHNWEELDMFASERKSPIGWEPFLELAKKSGAPREVQSR